MKRKIIKQGHNTLTVTLPSEWAKQFNLKSGEYQYFDFLWTPVSKGKHNLGARGQVSGDINNSNDYISFNF